MNRLNKGEDVHITTFQAEQSSQNRTYTRIFFHLGQSFSCGQNCPENIWEKNNRICHYNLEGAWKSHSSVADLRMSQIMDTRMGFPFFVPGTGKSHQNTSAGKFDPERAILNC